VINPAIIKQGTKHFQMKATRRSPIDNLGKTSKPTECDDSSRSFAPFFTAVNQEAEQRKRKNIAFFKCREKGEKLKKIYI